jgi:formamidopyrimidine-DNA glycosylase
MPELPEVTTTVNGLHKVLPGLRFVDIWTDLAKKNQTIKQFKDTIKSEKFYKEFRKKIIGKKVLKVERRAKNILIHISGGYTILIHLKMTGHLLYGKYIFNKKENKWIPDEKERVALSDPYNRFLHVVFTFSSPGDVKEISNNLAFCDSRKFGKVTIIPTHILENSHFKDTGPEPLDKSFTLSKFKTRLLLKPNWKIKTVLMDQSIIAGIGNIYSDEMLWSSGIHPESNPKNIPYHHLTKLYNEMKKVLTKGIDFGGDSMSDYRNIHGLRGDFQNHHNVYKKKNVKCSKKDCIGVIIRKVINGRSAHYCPVHQKLFN